MAFWDLHYRFPSELLSEIFLHLISSPAPTQTSTIYHPLLVSHICTHWRTAALTTPRLWARLFLQLSLAKTDTQAGLVHLWMERSGGCPLTIYVFWEDPPFASSHPALECLLEHSSRWKEAFFYLPFDVIKRFGQIVGKLPLLTELSLGTGTEAQDLVFADQGEDVLEMFKIAPRLTSLECVNLSPFLFRFPWRNLTHVPVMAVTIDECLSILRQSTRLEKAGFIFLPSTSSSLLPPVPLIPPAPTTTATTVATTTTTTTPTTATSHHRVPPPIHHPYLTEFSILTSPWDESIDLSPLFPLLSFPALTSLTICNLKSHFGGAGFTTFLSRLLSLQVLHLRKTALSDQNLVAGLKVVPSVDKLVVHPLKEGMGPPTVTECVFDELRWKSWVVDGVDYSEQDDDDDDDEASSSSRSSASGSSDGSGGAWDRDGRRQQQQKQPKTSNLPLLPKLTSIEVKLDNTLADAFIHMVHSRRTSIHLPRKQYRVRNSKHGRAGVIGSGEDDEDGSADEEEGELGEEEEEEVLELDKPTMLKHVRIRYSEPLHPHFLSELEELQNDGLVVELDYMNENGGIEFNVA